MTVAMENTPPLMKTYSFSGEEPNQGYSAGPWRRQRVEVGLSFLLLDEMIMLGKKSCLSEASFL